MEFYIVDAFSKTAFGGNPAGVVPLSNDEDYPKDEIMVKIAKEIGYSETVFVKKLGENHFQMKYFTPTAEVDLCGHATVAAVHVLKENNLIQGREISLETKAGSLKALIEDENIFLQMGEAKLIEKVEKKEEIEKIYESLGASYNDNLPVPYIVSTGLADIMVAIKDLNTLNTMKPNMEKICDISKKYKVTGIHAYCLSDDEFNAHTRNFAPLYDIDEEAATGTSTGALSYTFYLLGKSFIDKGATLSFLQGEAMNRPSQIYAKIENLDPFKVLVGGSAYTLVEMGNLKI